jgi:hypothetical protein
MIVVGLVLCITLSSSRAAFFAVLRSVSHPPRGVCLARDGDTVIRVTAAVLDQFGGRLGGWV